MRSILKREIIKPNLADSSKQLIWADANKLLYLIGKFANWNLGNAIPKEDRYLLWL